MSFLADVRETKRSPHFSNLEPTKSQSGTLFSTPLLSAMPGAASKPQPVKSPFHRKKRILSAFRMLLLRSRPRRILSAVYTLNPTQMCNTPRVTCDRFHSSVTPHRVCFQHQPTRCRKSYPRDRSNDGLFGTGAWSNLALKNRPHRGACTRVVVCRVSDQVRLPLRAA